MSGLKKQRRHAASDRIVGIYLAVGILWILVSDLFTFEFGYSIGAIKGVAFVVTTGLLLFFLIRRFERELDSERVSAVESANRFQTLVESAPFGVFIQTAGVLSYLNPAALRMFGAKSAAELIGLPALERFHPDFHDRVRHRTETLIRDHQPVPPADERCLGLDGGTFDVEVSAVPFESQGEDGALVYMSDISERVSRERLFREMAETIPANVWIVGSDGSVRYLNERWYSYTGQERGEENMNSWTDAIHPDDVARVLGAWSEALATQSLYEARLRYRRYDGEYRWYMARALPVSGPGGRVVNWFGISTDIDEPTRLIEHLDQAAENERLRLSRELHDDLGQLLAAAKLHIELVLRNPADFDARLDKARADLVACMQRTRNMAMMMRPAILQHGGVVAALRAQAADFQASTNIPCRFVSKLDSVNLPYGHALAVYRVTQEALTNVAKHSGANGALFELCIVGERLRASVVDNGHGFDADNRSRLRGLGVIGMTERALGVGGVLTIQSSADGTRVQMEVPLPSGEGAEREWDAQC